MMVMVMMVTETNATLFMLAEALWEPRWLILSNSIQQVSLLSFLVAITYGCEGDDTGVCCGVGEWSMVGAFMLSR